MCRKILCAFFAFIQLNIEADQTGNVWEDLKGCILQRPIQRGDAAGYPRVFQTARLSVEPTFYCRF